MNNPNNFYPKDGEQVAPDYKLPDPVPIPRDPGRYVMDPGLEAAINVALLLGLPLLVTGEPGTGKTLLAYHIAHVFRLGDVLEFNAKTTSNASDLFYRYDALKRFQDGVNAKGIEHYIEFQALGKAVLAAMDPNDPHPKRPKEYEGIEARRSVVLIDEIDKAPRDLPNDILNEIDRMEFTVPDLSDQPFKADKKHRPILIMTSNSERDLPDAFLRRCAYYNIPFPGATALRKILKSHGLDEELTNEAIVRFLAVRGLPLVKKPATGELLAWALALHHCGFKAEDLIKEAAEMRRLDAVMVKTEADRATLDRADLNSHKTGLESVRAELARPAEDK